MENSKSKTNHVQKSVLLPLLAFLIIVLIFVSIWAYKTVMVPKPDYENFNAKILDYLNKIGNVTNVRKSTESDDTYFVTIKKKSWAGSEMDKVGYCDSIRKTFTGYAWDYRIISKDNTIYVIFETEDGIKLAEPDGIGFGKYKIYY